MRNYLIFFAIAGAISCSDSLVEPNDGVRGDATNIQSPDGPDGPDSTDTAANNVVDTVDPANNPIDGNRPDPRPDPDPNANPNLPDPYKGWALTAGGVGNDWPQAVASDADGNVFVGGSFEAPFSIDSTTISPQYGAADAFILAFDKDGEFLWHVVYGSAGPDLTKSLATDANGNVFVAGEHEGELRIGGVAKPAAGALDAHVLKFTPTGTLAWARSFGGDRRDSAEAVTVSAAGQVTVVGRYNTNIALSPLSVENETGGGGNDIFVANLDAVTGAARWLEPMTGYGSDIATAVAAHDAGSVVVGVSTQWGLQVGSQTWPGSDSFSVGLVTFDSEGNILWTRHIDGGDGIALADLAVSDDGKVFGVGSFRGVVDFGAATLNGAGLNFEAWAAAWDPAGESIWAEQLGGNMIDQGMGIALANDNVLVAGRFTDELLVQGNSTVSNGGYDIFVATFARADGTSHSLVAFGGTDDEQPGGVAFDGELGFFVAGYTQGTFEFDGSSFAAPGAQLDAFVVRGKP